MKNINILMLAEEPSSNVKNIEDENFRLVPHILYLGLTCTQMYFFFSFKNFFFQILGLG